MGSLDQALKQAGRQRIGMEVAHVALFADDAFDSSDVGIWITVWIHGRNSRAAVYGLAGK